ncbi:MAG: glucosaminidase domain-containing protein [Holosporaceae bacterium]|nr:glucosaminidase domain-containing protein [Holosporaceae bacterium]
MFFSASKIECSPKDRDELFECDKTVEYLEVKEILEKADITAIPNFALKNIPPVASSYNFSRSLFIRAVASTIGKVNEFIEKQRKFVAFVWEKEKRFEPLTTRESERLRKIRRFYQTSDFVELLLRVAPIPVSLAVAQAALESRFGSDRRICRRNAYFGLVESRTSLIRFDTLFNSAVAYAKTLNVNPRYGNFRRRRRLIMESSKKLSGTELIPFVAGYGTNKNYAKLALKFIRCYNLEILDSLR